MAAIPLNDNFADAVVTTEPLPFIDGRTTSGATTETGEPSPCSDILSTVWYQFTPSSDVDLVANTAGSDYDTVLSVYTGSAVGSLTGVACNDDISFPDNLQSEVAFTATAGVAYHFQIGGFSGETGNLVFNLASTVSDFDGDGVPDGSDNCLSVPNGPNEAGTPGVGNQTNTDADLAAAGATLALGVPLVGDALGDACDDEDDNDSGLVTQDPGAAATECPTGEVPLWADCVEAYLGTDPLDNCSADTIANNEPVDALPPDLNDDRSVNILDVFEMQPVWLGPGIRQDLNADGSVNILDVFKMQPVWLQTCS